MNVLWTKDQLMKYTESYCYRMLHLCMRTHISDKFIIIIIMMVAAKEERIDGRETQNNRVCEWERRKSNNHKSNNNNKNEEQKKEFNFIDIVLCDTHHNNPYDAYSHV